MLSNKPSFEELATYVLAGIILMASFYGLLKTSDPNSVDARAIYGGMIGAVSTWLFQERASRQATRHAIDAQNNGMQGVRASVARIEDGRPPTEAERVIRDSPSTHE